MVHPVIISLCELSQPASMRIQKQIPGCCWSVCGSAILVFNWAEFFGSYDFESSEFTVITERQEVMQEQLKFVTIFNLWLNSFPSILIPLLNLFECLVVKFVQSLCVR